MYEGRASIVLRPGTTDEVSKILALAHEHGIPVVPQAGNTGLVGGQIPMRGEILLSVGRLKRVRARRRRRLHHDGRGRPDARRGAGRRRQGRPPVPAEPAVGGQLPDRRQPRHQRRRRRRAGLRQRAPAGAGARGRAGRRPRLERAQTRSRRTTPATTSRTCSSARKARSAIITAAVLKLVPQAGREGHGLRRAAGPRRRARRSSAWRRRRPGTSLTAFEFMPRTGARVRAAATCRARATRSPPRTPGTRCWKPPASRPTARRSGS